MLSLLRALVIVELRSPQVAWHGQKNPVSQFCYSQTLLPQENKLQRACITKPLLCSISQQIWKIQQWPQDWKRSVFIPVLKKGSAKECSDYRTVVLISHASKIMLKILQGRPQQYVLGFWNQELPDIQAGFRKGIGIRDQIATCRIIEKAREFQKNIYLCFMNNTKAFVHHSKLRKIPRDWNARSPYLSPKKTVCRSRNDSQNQT